MLANWLYPKGKQTSCVFMIESSKVGLCPSMETGRRGSVFLDGGTEMSNHVKEMVPRSLRKTLLGYEADKKLTL